MHACITYLSLPGVLGVGTIVVCAVVNSGVGGGMVVVTGGMNGQDADTAINRKLN